MLTLVLKLQWCLYFKTTDGSMKMWSFIAGGLKSKGSTIHKIALWEQNRWSYNKVGLTIKGYKIEGPCIPVVFKHVKGNIQLCMYYVSTGKYCQGLLLRDCSFSSFLVSLCKWQTSAVPSLSSSQTENLDSDTGCTGGDLSQTLAVQEVTFSDWLYRK